MHSVAIGGHATQRLVAQVEQQAVEVVAHVLLGHGEVDHLQKVTKLLLGQRHIGAKIGRGVWCETYWLPEADLVTLGRGATVNRGCVVQTHLFHDRIMAMDTVVLGKGATLGPHCVALPASSVGDGATVGPASLVMRGDSVPANTKWQGNPISPWAVGEGKRKRD